MLLICSSTAGRSVVEAVLKAERKLWQNGLVVMFRVLEHHDLSFR